MKVLLLAFVLLAAPLAAEDRPRLLMPLYAGQIGLQAYDAYSTLEVIRLGGVERNPYVNALIVRRPGAFVVLKAGIAAASIVSAEMLWKRGRRTEAVFVMIGSNAFMAYVAANNGRVLHQMRNGR